VRGLYPRIAIPIERFVFADTDPSSVADFVRATFSHKGRRKGEI
jgi:hypothetical protein